MAGGAQPGNAQHEHACPLCDVDLLVGTCPSCGLWWTSRAEIDVKLGPSAAPEESASRRFSLRERFPFAGALLTLVFGAFGWCGLWAGIYSVLHDPSWYDWIAFVAGAAVGGLVGVTCTASIARELLHAISPSRLVREGTSFRMRAWRTWGGLWRGFRRTNVLVPHHEITGVELHRGQGTLWYLFLAHVSGLSLGTGWAGEESAGRQLGERLDCWIRNDEGSRGG